MIGANEAQRKAMTRTGQLRSRAVVSIAALVICSTASADTLRCGNKVISRGDHVTRVLRYCGEPTAVQSWVVQRGVVGFGSVLRPGFGFVEDVLIEEWTYNFGPQKLMRQIRFANGFVEKVEHLGYGYLPVKDSG